MEFPVTFDIAGHPIYLHFILEYLAFFIGYRVFVWEKKIIPDTVNSINRLYAILGATIGALVGSRLIGSLEDPKVFLSGNFLEIYQSKTIMGGLFGGLVGVEAIKKIIGEKTSTGDMFVIPICIALIIGRTGCFSMGVFESTYGNPTTFFTGLDLGDGIKRHPTSLYEIVFLLILIPFFWRALKQQKFVNGTLFKVFMLLYFAFRFCIEFIKPHTFLFLGLSTIQLLCIVCWIYYSNFIIRIINKPSSLLRFYAGT